MTHAQHSPPTWLTPFTTIWAVSTLAYIQFRMEESDRSLPFLDILLSREGDGYICTSVHRKATYTNQYLCFHCHHPVAHKRAVVRTQMCRAESISSSGVKPVSLRQLCTKHLWLCLCCFVLYTGVHILQSVAIHWFIKTYSRNQQTPCDLVAHGSVTLPYISGLPESIRRVLAPLAIQVTFRPYRTLRQEHVHPKDPVPANRRKGVIYSIPCAECPRTYIGQTGRSLDHRLCEHRQALKNRDIGSSALAEDVFSANHQVDLSKAMVIDTHNHTQLESWHIQHHQSPSTGRRAPCQDSMLHYCPDRASIWRNPIFVLLQWNLSKMVTV